LSDTPAPPDATPPALPVALEMAQGRGLLGPTIPIADHIAHARALGRCLVETLGQLPHRLLDLGSGGGIPGLVLATDWPDIDVVLLDAQQRATDTLTEAIDLLGLPRCRALRGRAEDLARSDTWREHFDAVTARSFGPPAVAAECASGFLETGGVMIVAEPPGAPPRWDPVGLTSLGLELVAQQSVPVAVAALRKVCATPADVPRASGRPAKRPRW
jgi:16S rRNA (guanine527-N7)-methyltransferase